MNQRLTKLGNKLRRAFRLDPAAKRLHKREIRQLVGRDDAVILEIGCNDGHDSLGFLRQFPAAAIHCFEPDPRAVVRFKANVNDSRCRLHELAISDVDGVTRLHMSGGRSPGEPKRENDWDLSSSIHRPTGHLQDYPWCKFDHTCQVSTRSLDSWVAEQKIPRVDFIWADTQGAERNLIAGGLVTLMTKTRYLYTEFYNREMYEGQITLAEIQRRLPGFELLDIYEGYNALFRNKALAAA